MREGDRNKRGSEKKGKKKQAVEEEEQDREGKRGRGGDWSCRLVNASEFLSGETKRP